MARDVVIRISAQDAASPVFKRLSSEAQQMGATVEQSSQKSGRAFDDFNRKAALMGAAIGSATLVLGQFAQKAAEEEVVFARLRQSIEATGKSYEDYAASVDQVIAQGEELSFADDQVADALARLTTQTGDAQVAIDQMGLAMDVARARNINLGTAAELVGKVHQGNIGILQRYGIAVEEGATATEALATLQQRTAGQAEAYAETTQGSIDRAKNAFDNLTESIGAHTGGMQELLLLLPGLTAGYTALAAAIGGVGAGLLKVVGPLALVAGAGIYAQQLNQRGSGTERTTAGALGGIAGFIPNVIPGSFGDALFADIQAQFLGIINSRDFEEAATGALISPFEVDAGGEVDLDTLYNRVANLLGVAPGTMSNKELEQLADLRAQAGGFGSTGQFLVSSAASNPNFIQTPSGSYVPLHVYQEQLRQNAMMLNQQIAAGQTSYVGAPGTGGLQNATGVNLTPNQYYGTQPTGYTGPYQPANQAIGGNAYGTPEQWRANNLMLQQESAAGSMATMGAASVTDWREQAQSLKDYRDALAAGRVELELLNGVQMNSADAQMTFKVTQDLLIEGQQEYTGQLGEYQTQLGYIDSAVDLLNQRKADGIALSAEEQTFLDNAASGQERLQGGVEDATIALGMQALQYAENMKLGDQLNDSMDGVNDSVGGLTESINALIETLGGVPPETKADVTTNAPEATAAIEATGAAATAIDGTNATVSVDADTSSFWAAIGGISGSIVGTAYLAVSAAGAAVGDPGGGMHGLTAMAHGGTAFDPLSNGISYALVGEVGPEIVKLARGDQVMPSGGSRAVMERGRRGDGQTIIVHGPTYIYPASTDVEQAVTRAYVGEWR